jgi:protein TonB
MEAEGGILAKPTNPSIPGFHERAKRLSWPLVCGIAALHLAALYGLALALAPDFTTGVERQVVSAFTVTTPTRPDPPPVTASSA